MLHGSCKILRIHGARSRPIIHLERSASASPLEFAPDPARLRAALQATSGVSDRACAAQNHAPGMRLHPSQLHLHSTGTQQSAHRPALAHTTRQVRLAHLVPAALFAAEPARWWRTT